MGAQAVEQWRVALPYTDTSLNRNFGVKDAPIRTIFVVEVSSKSRLEVIRAAKENFYSSKGPSPFNARTKKNSITMIILESEAVVELLHRT